MSAKTVAEGRRLWNEWLAVHQKPPAVIFHYTTAEGLLGMLESRQLWATNVRFMNDTSEMAHGIELAREMFRTLEPEMVRSRSRGLAFGVAREQLGLMLDDAAKYTKYFAVSFCADGNLLSQWRGYGQLGGGFAVGFRSHQLVRYAPEILPGVQYDPGVLAAFLRKVVYDADVQRKLVRRWIELLVDTLAPAGEEKAMRSGDLWNSEPVNHAFRMLYECLVCFKHHGFAEEGEWRLVQQGRVSESDICRTKFRARSGRLVSFAPLTFEPAADGKPNNLPITEVVYGPSLDTEAADRAVRWLLENYRFDAEVNIRPSGIPFTG